MVQLELDGAEESPDEVGCGAKLGQDAAHNGHEDTQQSGQSELAVPRQEMVTIVDFLVEVDGHKAEDGGGDTKCVEDPMQLNFFLKLQGNNQYLQE